MTHWWCKCSQTFLMVWAQFRPAISEIFHGNMCLGCPEMNYFCNAFRVWLVSWEEFYVSECLYRQCSLVSKWLGVCRFLKGQCLGGSLVDRLVRGYLAGVLQFSLGKRSFIDGALSSSYLLLGVAGSYLKRLVRADLVDAVISNL